MAVIRLHREPARNRVVMTLTGTVAVQGWSRSVVDLITEGLWTDRVVYHLSGADCGGLSEALPAVAILIEDVAAEHGPIPAVAVVVRREELSEWRAGLHQHCPDLTLAAFADLESAHGWLDERSTPS